MITNASTSFEERQGISLPNDIDDFLRMISIYYENRDIDHIMKHVSNDFLHQGMNKEAYKAILKESFLLRYVDWMKIKIQHFQREGNLAILAGFAESNLGVMPASEHIFPLIEGSRLILEGEGWKLLGNQSKSPLGLYKAFHQISSYFIPDDIPLYRSLLPTLFDMPQEPTVYIKVADHEQVRFPLQPYKMAHIQILAEFEGLQGWYTLTMPENEWMPVEGGKTIGYPKYVADSLQWGEENGSWVAEVNSAGDNALSISLQFEEDRSTASWFERKTSKPPLIFFRKMLPSSKERPWFLIMPIEKKEAQGNALLLRGDPMFSGVPRIKETFGRIRALIKTNQPWAGLFPSELTTRGVIMQFWGELNLRHRLITVV